MMLVSQRPRPCRSSHHCSHHVELERSGHKHEVGTENQRSWVCRDLPCAPWRVHQPEPETSCHLSTAGHCLDAGSGDPVPLQMEAPPPADWEPLPVLAGPQAVPALVPPSKKTRSQCWLRSRTLMIGLPGVQ